jgi:hypothetical protein
VWSTKLKSKVSTIEGFWLATIPAEVGQLSSKSKVTTIEGFLATIPAEVNFKNF